MKGTFDDLYGDSLILHVLFGDFLLRMDHGMYNQALIKEG